MTPFGVEMQQLRGRAGLSQGEVAKRLGLKQAQLSALERGRRGPPTRKLCQALGVVLQLTEHELARIERAAARSCRRFVASAGDGPEVFELLYALTITRERVHPRVIELVAELILAASRQGDSPNEAAAENN